MLQPLLADRFKLALHHESRKMSGYALTVARAGIKAKVSEVTDRAGANGGRGILKAVGCHMIPAIPAGPRQGRQNRSVVVQYE
jgi:uncharacterized protein (TIGR03435 family)